MTIRFSLRCTWSGWSVPQGAPAHHALRGRCPIAHLNGARVQCGSTFLGHWEMIIFGKQDNESAKCASPLAWLIWLCSLVGIRPDEWLRAGFSFFLFYIEAHQEALNCALDRWRMMGRSRQARNKPSHRFHAPRFKKFAPIHARQSCQRALGRFPWRRWRQSTSIWLVTS